MNPTWNRRAFIQSLAAASLVGPNLARATESNASSAIPLGFDNFSIRSMKWKAPQLIDYAASLKMDYLLMSDLDVYESHDDAYLKSIKEHAERVGLKLHAGTGSICPTSNSFNKKFGTAEDHAKFLIRVANGIGSSVARCYLGNMGDRNGEGGIERHMEEMVKVCKSVQSYAQDMGVKLAIENHAGDMQAWELAQLVESAGRDHVGVTLDSGNATWTIEDPLTSFEILAPYALSSGMRDSMIWEDEKGLQVQWVNMGQGLVDWKTYADRYRALCPGVPFILEIISGGPRGFATLDPNFWKPFPRARAHEFARFVALAKSGRPYEQPADRPTSAASNDELSQHQQKYDLETSIAFCRTSLGMGQKS